MMRFTDACLSVPRVLLLLTIVALWDASPSARSSSSWGLPVGSV